MEHVETVPQICTIGCSLIRPTTILIKITTTTTTRAVVDMKTEQYWRGGTGISISPWLKLRPRDAKRETGTMNLRPGARERQGQRAGIRGRQNKSFNIARHLSSNIAAYHSSSWHRHIHISTHTHTQLGAWGVDKIKVEVEIEGKISVCTEMNEDWWIAGGEGEEFIHLSSGAAGGWMGAGVKQTATTVI